MNYLDLFNNITDFARKSNDIKAMILFGSRCRSENVADEWSDYDLMFFVDNPDSFIYKDEWLEEIGNVKISFVQPIVPQNLERRIIFEDGTDVDFIFYDVKDSRKILENETILLWFSRGFNILVDKCNCEKLIKEKTSLVIEKQMIENTTKAKNSKIENKVDALMNRAFVNRQTAEDKIANIDRRIKKIEDEIKLEKQYNAYIGDN